MIPTHANLARRAGLEKPPARKGPNPVAPRLRQSLKPVGEQYPKFLMPGSKPGFAPLVHVDYNLMNFLRTLALLDDIEKRSD